MQPNLLILGGTVEASALARAVASLGIRAEMSMAGRVARHKPQPIPVREGGFGGAYGLADYIQRHNISHVVDATHPFAAQMSENAIAACQSSGAQLVAFTRAAWTEVAGDRWTHVPDLKAASATLDRSSRRVFLAIGRMHLEQFSDKTQHFYLLRLVDKPTEPLAFADHKVIVARGPFDPDADLSLLHDHDIDLVVSKNAGGSGAYAKIEAARKLGIEVVMIQRPKITPRHEVHSAEAVMTWLKGHKTDLGV